MDDLTAYYIAEVAESIAERIQRHADDGYAEVNDLAADVAWIARQLQKIARAMEDGTTRTERKQRPDAAPANV